MESLLRWGIENSVPASGDASELHQVAAEVAAGKRKDLLDPALYEAIMGKSDAVLMKEAMAAATDKGNDVEQRIVALENFEMLVEQIDNANNLEFLNFWAPLIELLIDPEDEIRQHACWVCGTAVQNNAQAQNAFMKLNPLPTLLALISTVPAPSDLHLPAHVSKSSQATRSRAMYALSGTLKHNAYAIGRMDDHEGWGWQVLKGGLSDPSMTIRRKTAFLLSTLLLLVAAPTSEFTLTFRPAPTTSNPTPRSSSTAVTLAPTQANEFPTDSSKATPSVPSPSYTSILKSFEAHGIPSVVLDSLRQADFPRAGADGDEPPANEDPDYKEKAGRVLISLLEKNGLTEELKAEFGTYWLDVKKEQGGVEKAFEVGKEEAVEIEKLLSLQRS
ncbi:Armadillo/beta-catenin-like repeat-containing protein [Phaffia rhodozyma]|uniref:Armadillo/beta-catenin-like repeat-containing protein n=1 Tax=Phaffia rhodozyma TaxID=264483 RepID=A0A0F7SRM0_PHARH|nr:Armadillo/beta-catenin-like repeat-containing protein [Phaffia rhodozyma]